MNEPGEIYWNNNGCARVLRSVQLFVTPCTVAGQALLSMGLSRLEYWCGLPFPPPWDLSDSDWTRLSCISCIGRWILYHWVTWEVPAMMVEFLKLWSENLKQWSENIRLKEVVNWQWDFLAWFECGHLEISTYKCSTLFCAV